MLTGEKLCESKQGTAQVLKAEQCRPFAGVACCCEADDRSHLLFKLLPLNSWQLLCTDISKQSLFTVEKRYITSSSSPLLIGIFSWWVFSIKAHFYRKTEDWPLAPRHTGVCVSFLLAFPSYWTSFTGERRVFNSSIRFLQIMGQLINSALLLW